MQQNWAKELSKQLSKFEQREKSSSTDKKGDAWDLSRDGGQEMQITTKQLRSKLHFDN